MDRLGVDGLAMPWGVAYIRPDCMSDLGLKAHEAKHLEQIRRMGPVVFTITYFYQLARYGYWDAPLEIEARQAQG